MQSPIIREFIHQQSNLFWHIPEKKKKEISQEVLVETILNYGDIKAVKQLLAIMGIDEVAKTFYSITDKSIRKKGNLHELTVNYFTLFFEKYAHRNI
jgi:hypothetical protein